MRRPGPRPDPPDSSPPSPGRAPIHLAYLADNPNILPTVAGWQYGEWGFLDPDDSSAKRVEKLRGHLHRNRIPLTVVAVSGDEALGSADLVHCDLPGWEGLSPWLSCVYVAPEHRHRGVGTQLTRRAAAEAARLGFEALYLCTWERESFYRRLGWETLHRFSVQGAEVVIMAVALGGVGDAGAKDSG